MFQRILFAALLAGLCAAIAVTVVQLGWSVPLIQQAENYETAAPPAQPAAPRGHAQEVRSHEDHEAHVHDDTAWAPANGLERTFWTFLTNLLLGVGSGLLLGGIFALRKTAMDWRSGLAWGAAAFATFTLAPALGLPPELPGTAAAELGARQAWWLWTVVATGAGIAVLAFAKRAGLRVGGIALLTAPHVVGAPQPARHEALAPLALQHEFIAAALISSACFWIVLGAAAGYFAGRFRPGTPPHAKPGPA